tara:strand:+ start:729 stop:995 length:267 start_codon:yes stop_codon:yes gene_type:complete
MIDKPTKTVSSELTDVRVLNMSTAKYFGLVKEYCEIVSKTREASKDDIQKHGIQAELSLYFSVKKDLNQLILQKLMREKIIKFGGNKK